jgi:alpha-tubulin suppressor-like RCC1 family protein
MESSAFFRASTVAGAADELRPVLEQIDAAYELSLRGETVADIAVGSTHACSLTAAGKAYCWGNGAGGVLGSGDLTDRVEPTPVSGDLVFTDLAVASWFSIATCGLASGGHAYCWGYDTYGTLGNGPGDAGSASAPVAVATDLVFESISVGGTLACGIVADGKVYCWGSTSLPNGTYANRRDVPTLLTDQVAFRSLSLGDEHGCGVTTEGRAVCWGAGEYGRLGNGPSEWASAPTPVSGPLTWKSVVAGNSFSCGIADDAQAYCWGYAYDGALGTGQRNEHLNVPTPVAGGLTFASLYAGVGDACGITTDGESYCWGLNWAGQIGDGTTESPAQPTRVASDLRFDALSLGTYRTCGLAGGKAFCWGHDYNGRLGVGPHDTESYKVLVPTPVIGVLSW